MNVISENAQRIASANKQLGQNFILDMNITRKITNFADITQNDKVIEIGPGPGGLTLAILEKHPQSLTVIEKDARCLPGLELLTEKYGKQSTVHILHDDALSENIVFADQSIIVANLPYNVASPLLIKFIHQYKQIKKMVLMFQKEVAQRIVAPPNNKHYGRLSIITQAFFEPKIVYHLPPSVFTPPPKVDSAVVYFSPKILFQEIPIAELEYVTQIFFSSRRKTVGHIVKKHLNNNLSAQEILKPYLHLRPENLTVDTYIQVASTIKN